MPGVYASFDVVVLPSLVESVPMCLLEAMAASKPVIATRVGAVPKIIIPEETGLLLQPGDVEGLAAAISRLLTDAALARRLGENGCEHVRQHFSATSMAKAYLQTYAGVLASREGAQSNAALEVSRG
jgi:glycosyltransferase involved in cell wall biosynthesis